MPEAVTVLLFGPQKQMAGVSQLQLMPEQMTVGGVMAALAAQCPALASSLPHSRLAVNQAYATDSDVLTHTDELALIGMVSGG